MEKEGERLSGDKEVRAPPQLYVVINLNLKSSQWNLRRSDVVEFVADIAGEQINSLDELKV